MFRVDRSEWNQHLRYRISYDEMAQKSQHTVRDVTSGAENIIRDLMGVEYEESLEELLRRLGALTSERTLTRAGSLLFCPSNRSWVELTVFDVSGGSILNREEGRTGQSLLEQIYSIESSLRGVNTRTESLDGLHIEGTRLVPEEAVREAILNGIAHRDWNRSEPLEIRWTTLDSSLLVRSPGGFYGSVNADNILSNREARYPALSDLLRALGLVEKQGIGVDRMYQSMIALGHETPEIRDIEGAFIECLLIGGTPNRAVVDVFRAITPLPRQRDTKVALLLHQLFYSPFITLESLAKTLQGTEADARLALQVALQTVAFDHPLVEPYKTGTWLLSSALRKRLAGQQGPGLRPLLPYLSKDREEIKRAALLWRDSQGSITSGELAKVCSLAVGTAKSVLEELKEEGRLSLLGAGRSTRYE